MTERIKYPRTLAVCNLEPSLNPQPGVDTTFWLYAMDADWMYAQASDADIRIFKSNNWTYVELKNEPAD